MTASGTLTAPSPIPRLELDTAAVCEALSCSRSHLNHLRQTQQLRATVRGKKVTFAMDELLRFVEAGRQAS
jgi:hypothetical protein